MAGQTACSIHQTGAAATAKRRATRDWTGLVTRWSANTPMSLPLPRIYPTPEGGVQMEWTLGRIDISLEIDLGDHTGYWHWFDINDFDRDGDERVEAGRQRQLGLACRRNPTPGGIAGMNKETRPCRQTSPHWMRERFLELADQWEDETVCYLIAQMTWRVNTRPTGKSSAWANRQYP